MEEITNEMIINCLQFIQEEGGGVTRYSFDRYVIRNVKVRESFNLVPKRLLEEELISILKSDKETMIVLTDMGIKMLSA